jgi:hypothetical protein
MAYYSVGIDAAQAERHPDWEFQDHHGRPFRFMGFRAVCLNSPYRRFALEQMREVLANYPIDGLWLDILRIGRHDQDCLCAYCRAEFSRSFPGKQLLNEQGTALSFRWRLDSLDRFLSEAIELAHSLRPGIPVTFNDAGLTYRGHLADGPIDVNLAGRTDLLSYEAHNSVRQSSISKALQAQGRPFEVGMPNTLPSQLAGSWIGWWVKPSAVLTLEATIVAAHGGTPYVGMMVHPDGSLFPGELETLGETGAWLRDRGPWLHGGQPVVDTAILHQNHGLGLKADTAVPYHPPEQPQPESLPEQPPRDFEPLPRPTLCNGMETALRHHHNQYAVIHEDQPLDRFRVLVLQGDTVVDPPLAGRIREWVGDGGCLIAEYHAGLLADGRARRDDFVLADVLGIHFDGYAGSWDANYLELTDRRLAGGIPRVPVMVVGPAVRVALDGAQSLALVHQPLGGYRTLERHTASRFNPPGQSTGAAAVTLHRFGRGQALYFASAIGDHITARHLVDPWPIRLVAHALDLLLPEPVLLTNAPAGVELLLNRHGPSSSGGRLVLHAFNHYVTGVPGDAGRDGLLVGPTSIRLNRSRVGEVRSAHLVPEWSPLPIQHDETWFRLELPPFTMTSAVLLETAD